MEGGRDKDGPNAPVSRREMPYRDETVRHTLGKEAVHADSPCVRVERGRDGFKAEDVIEKGKACELILGSSMLSAWLFVPYSFLLKSAFDAAYHALHPRLLFRFT